ncbi:MAG: HAD-IIIA family hydrolase [Methylovirgula sp.]
MFNGDSWFDFNLLDLVTAKSDGPASIINMALRHVEDGSRYGTVETNGDRVVRFRAKSNGVGKALVNAGVYVVDREILAHLQQTCSFENDVLQPLAQKGLIAGRVYDAFFIDIGIPTDYMRAQIEIPDQQRRGAVFLDRDGVINADYGYVGQIARFEWLPGVKEAIKSLNDSGRFVFVVTNQAGVARGLYGEEAVHDLHAHINRELAEIGAHIDDFRYCPYHPEGSVAAYARTSDWRKPAPGMLLDLMACWPVDRTQSIMIGNQDSDVEAGRSAGLRAYRINPDESLARFVAEILPPPCVDAAPTARL